MKCVICKHGETIPGEMTSTFERNDTIVVVKGVPAEVCRSCGEGYISQETTKKLLKILSEAVKQGVQLDVRKYVAA
ncbi:MAG: type II toxin-antitoxin system MqsA family antitoxin [Oligoflexia bacterium]|nr:type II toxin-antitoxin system MqsA family antitoxin [Oligoflexia bacterium]